MKVGDYVIVSGIGGHAFLRGDIVQVLKIQPNSLWCEKKYLDGMGIRQTVRQFIWDGQWEQFHVTPVIVLNKKTRII